jgi:hypothetical protein
MQARFGVDLTGAEVRSRRGSVRLGLAVGGLLVVVVGAWLWTNSTGPLSALDPGPGPAKSSPPPEFELPFAAGAEAGVQSRLDMSEPSGSGPEMGGTSSGTVRTADLLADFWGDDWPAIEAEARASGNGAVLDYEIPPEEMPAPWMEIEAQLDKLLAAQIEKDRAMLPVWIGARSGAKWPSPLTSEFLVETWQRGLKAESLTEDVLRRANDATKELTWEIDREERELVDAYHAACKQLIRTHRYGRAHYFYMTAVERALVGEHDWDRARWSPTVVWHGGWLIAFQLFKDENLALQHMAQEMRALYKERARALRLALR